MIRHSEINNEDLRKQIRKKVILFGGNRKLKIYGVLNCYSGKRMKRDNRVFFASEVEAKSAGYRPCGHCMKSEYKQWIYLGDQ
jgi:methylphosphotriester-DNA--protein-cysteine methyltransferase